MPTILNFPNFPHVSNAWNLDANVISPGQTADGEFPLIRFDGGGRWRATITGITHFTPNDVKLFRALRIASRGGFVPFVVPREEAMLRPFAAGDTDVTSTPGVPFSDGSLFSDGTGFYQPSIVASLVNAGALNDTTLTIRMLVGSDLTGGESFSILHPTQNWRLYEICSVTKINDSDFTVEFDPPLRDDIDAGSAVDFEKPRCVMRIATPKAFDFTLQTYPFASPTVEFIEQVFPV